MCPYVNFENYGPFETKGHSTSECACKAAFTDITVLFLLIGGILDFPIYMLVGLHDGK